MRTELTDGFVLLRAIDTGDFEHYWEAANESLSEISLWMGLPWPNDAKEKAAVKRWYVSNVSQWKNGVGHDFSVFDAKGTRYLGHCYFSDINPAGTRANLGYWVRTSQTRRGVATAAVRLLASFALKKLDLVRIEIVVATGNIASQRVAEKSGARREGILRNRLAAGDRVLDAVMYSLIPSDIQ